MVTEAENALNRALQPWRNEFKARGYDLLERAAIPLDTEGPQGSTLLFGLVVSGEEGWLTDEEGTFVEPVEVWWLQEAHRLRILLLDSTELSNHVASIMRFWLDSLP